MHCKSDHIVSPWRGWWDFGFPSHRYNSFAYYQSSMDFKTKIFSKKFHNLPKRKESFYNKKYFLQCCLKIPFYKCSLYSISNFAVQTFDQPISTMLSLWQRCFKQFTQVSFFHCRTSSVSKIPKFDADTQDMEYLVKYVSSIY